MLIAERRHQEARFSRNGVSGFQIRKCIVYWNAATIEEDRRRADLWRNNNIDPSINCTVYRRHNFLILKIYF